MYMGMLSVEPNSLLPIGCHMHGHAIGWMESTLKAAEATLDEGINGRSIQAQSNRWMMDCAHPSLQV